MNSLLSNINPSMNVLDIDLLKLKSDFERILLLVSDVCKVSDVFITLEPGTGSVIPFKIGLKGFSFANEFSCFKSLIEENRDIIVSDLKNDLRFKRIDSKNTFNFFAGFPVNTSSHCLVGTICILNKEPKELSSIELIILNHVRLEIESLLQVHVENLKLLSVFGESKNQFQLLIENSKEIFFQLDLDGNFTYVSQNWTPLVGHSIEEILGQNFSPYIHPDDVDSCFVFLNDILGKKDDKKEHIYRVLHKDGHYVWHSCKVGLLENKDGTFYAGAAREITKYVEGQNKLKEQKEFYEKILDGLPTGVAVYDSEFRYQYLNPAAIKNPELRQFAIGKTNLQYEQHAGRDRSFAENRQLKFEEAILKKQTITWEDTIHAKSGQISHHSRKITPVFNANGTLEMLIGFGIDVTKSKEIQEEILKSKQLISSILQNVAVGILVQGPQSEIVENNKAACEMLGLTQDQLLGKTSFDDYWRVIHLDGTNFKPEDHPVPRAIKHLKPMNNIVMGVHRPLTNDLVWLLVDAIPVFGNNKELLYVVCSFNDITTQKKAEYALKQSNERFIYSSMATSDAIWDWDIVTGKIFVGGSYATLFGHQFENNIITDNECEDFVHPDDRDDYFKSIDDAIAGKVTKWSGEYRYLKSDSTYADVRDKAIIIRDNQGNATRMIGAMQDISLEKKLKDELQQSEEQFKGAFKYSSIGMAIVDSTGHWKVVNSQIVQILGYTLEELNALTFSDLTHPDDLEEDLVNLKLMTSGLISSYTREKKYLHKNKSIVWGHLSVSLVKDSVGNPIHFIFQIVDITIKKRIEEANKLLIDENNKNKAIQLNEAKNMYRLLADNMVDLVCVHSLDANFQYVSPSISHILGYSPEDLIGLSPFEFVHPEDVVNLQKSITGFITEQEDISAKTRFRNKEGEYIWCETKASLVKENGIPVSFHSSTRDITQGKEAELAIRKALNQERELNELRTNLVSTISHEFRTPMTTIRASAELIMMYLDNQKLENYSLLNKRVNIIVGEIDRIVELMNTVLVISKNDLGKTNFSPITFDLKQTCLDVIEVSDFDQKEGRKVKTSFSGVTIPIFADKSLMEYILFNVLNNAFKYSQGFGGDIILNLFTTTKAIIIEIIDFGIGIPKEDQVKLFNTFFRASNTNGIQGTGLGLYIVKTFTERNSGSIQIESELGKGTKVTLQFPRPKLK
ncbi:PAS domain S-box protein [Flavobacterium sp. KS-LB2]|uniref:PAS domain-containing protein n=1 Tax=Flavobacterium sp. KS-LB2 TaxID=3120525 RepID=UPI0030CACC42